MASLLGRKSTNYMKDFASWWDVKAFAVIRCHGVLSIGIENKIGGGKLH
jgi:hypothetical protein